MTQNLFLNIDEIPRKVMTLFYLVDTSGSMAGSKISALNTAVRETLPLIEEISKTNSDSKIKIAVLEFSSGCEWMYPAPKDIESFEWRDLQASGLTSLGAAYDNLSNKLSCSHGFMEEPTGSYAPVIILLSDGAPTDHPEHALEKLKSNNWYKAATKIAIAIGDDCVKSTLINFTGNEEGVLTVHNIDELKKLIQMVSVTASRVNSKTTSIGKDADNKEIETISTLRTQINNDHTLAGIDVGTSTKNAGTDDWSGW